MSSGKARRDAFIENVLHGADRGIGASLVRGLLHPLAWLHQMGLEAYLLPYHTGIRKRYRLHRGEGQPVPVIAIGNLSSGGTGKTPMAALVAGRLKDQGRQVALISRGHGGSGEAGSAPRVVSDGEQTFLSPAEAGDEPVLLAHLLPGVPVIVGRDRRRSGRLAVERFAPEVIVCDDALQYWQLHRDLDIVLLDARRPFDNGHVLPRGLLREPPSHLTRAGIVVLTRADRVSAEALNQAKEQVRRLAPAATVFTAEHAPIGWVRVTDGVLLPQDALKGQEALAFAGIADAAAFFSEAERQGVRLREKRPFDDHHAYTAEEVTALAAIGLPTVTTEKDLVKVAPLWPVSTPPLYALRIGIKLDDEDAFFARIGQVLGGPRSRGIPHPATVPGSRS